MLVLLVAEVRSVQTLGPVAAIAASVLLAGLTLLPRCSRSPGVGASGRGAKPSYSTPRRWPLHARAGGDASGPGPPAPGACARHHLVFGVGALGLLAYKVDYSTTTFFKKQTDSGRLPGAREVVPRRTPGADDGARGARERSRAPDRPRPARRRLASVSDVAAVTPTGERSRDGTIGQLNVILAGDPYDSDALDVVPKLRDSVNDVAPGVRVLVGGGSAIQYDFDRANSRDLKLIAVGADRDRHHPGHPAQRDRRPAGADRVGDHLVLRDVRLLDAVRPLRRGDAGVDNSLPTFAFIFLVALGVDYTIFLMSRVREEARQYGTRDAARAERHRAGDHERRDHPSPARSRS